MADVWIGIDSSNLVSCCGDSGNTLDDALDGTDHWYHDTNHKHWFIIDLGERYNVKKFRGRSSTFMDPISVDIYVSETNGNWGAQVGSNISTWQDTSNWVEVDTTDKVGRYIKVEIETTENALHRLQWGHTSSPFTIFDVYGEFVGTESGYIKYCYDGPQWFDVNNSHYDSSCGDTGGHTASEALGGTDYWYHEVNETHWFIIDLGAEYNITKVRGRSNLSMDPIDVNVYVSTTNGNWGVAVASGISTWQDTNDWVEIDTTDKTGRYVKVEIEETEHWWDWIMFGDSSPLLPIFDVYCSHAKGIKLASSTCITDKVLRFYNGSNTVSLVLVTTADDDASPVRFYDGATTWAIKEYKE